MCLSIALSPLHASLPTQADRCVEQLDQAIALYHDGRFNDAERGLQTLTSVCRDLPQVLHNLGVLAAEREAWSEAIDWFEQALAADARAADTAQHLKNLHQYQAELAYAKALNSGRQPELPELRMQDSALRNAQRSTETVTDLHTVSTLEYELYAWWVAAADGNPEEWLAHYAADYPPPDTRLQTASLDWTLVEREISFTRNDAVVVLSYPEQQTRNHTLLLMRLQGNRWKIYQETRL